MVHRRHVLLAALLAGTLSACAVSPDTSGPLPEGGALVAAAAADLATLHSIRFDCTVSGVLPGLAVREVTGEAVLDGSPHGTAHGRADVQAPETSDRFETTWTLAGDSVALSRSLDGRVVRGEQPVTPGLTPAALLRGDTGLPALLGRATGLRTEGRETLQGVPSYRVTGTVPGAVIAAVLPGVAADVDVKFWVAQPEPHALTRIWLQVPPRQTGEGAVMLELGLSAPNAAGAGPPPGS